MLVALSWSAARLKQEQEEIFDATRLLSAGNGKARKGDNQITREAGPAGVSDNPGNMIVKSTKEWFVTSLTRTVVPPEHMILVSAV